MGEGLARGLVGRQSYMKRVDHEGQGGVNPLNSRGSEKGRSWEAGVVEVGLNVSPQKISIWQDEQKLYMIFCG